MLNPQQITAFSQEKTLTRYSLMEYYQHELLDSFYKQKGSEDFTFIGGTAIRIVYGGRRFSEDLDFDTPHQDGFEKLLEKVLHDMEAKGFELEFRLTHQHEYHCYIKFPQVLYKLGLSTHQDEKLMIKIDISTSQSQGTNYLLNNYQVFRQIKVLSPEKILAQKLLTISQRMRPKGRDLYDVIFLWGFTQPDEKYLQKICGQSLHEVLDDLLVFVKTLDLDVMKEEVRPFLLDPQDLDKVSFFSQYIKQQQKRISGRK